MLRHKRKSMENKSVRKVFFIVLGHINFVKPELVANLQLTREHKQKKSLITKERPLTGMCKDRVWLGGTEHCVLSRASFSGEYPGCQGFFSRWGATEYRIERQSREGESPSGEKKALADQLASEKTSGIQGKRRVDYLMIPCLLWCLEY